MTCNDTAEQRAQDLLARMTVTEKALQVSSVMPMSVLDRDGAVSAAFRASIREGIGHVAGIAMFGHKSPVDQARVINAVQRHLVTGTRLGIPAIFHNEALNGVVAPGFTAFPTAIGLAASWDPKGVGQMADLVRRQMRSVGLRQALSPLFDVARDARWGRVHETYGEDPCLVSAMAVAFTRGLQGTDLRDGVMATAKHFLGYGVTEAGQNMAATTVGDRELYEVYARPFEAAIRRAGLASVMNSYSECDGVPIGMSRELLTGLLRDRLGFAGTVVSDYMTIAYLRDRQLVASTAEQAGALALEAGLDVELPAEFGYGRTLAAAVEAGRVPGEWLDRSALRVLRDKFALGLFDNPYVAEDPIAISTVARQGDGLSRRLAAQSVTLLKNTGELLPLSTEVKTVAVLGPHADGVLVGFPAYTYPGAAQLMRGMAAAFGGAAGDTGAMAGLPELAPSDGVDVEALAAEMAPILAGELDDYVRERYGAVSLTDAVRAVVPDATVISAAGCGVTHAEPADIPAAVAAAAEADVVILALGGRGGWFGTNITEGEGSDTADIDLPAPQVELVRAIAELGKPTVGVLAMGRPYGLSSVVDVVPAWITGYYGGPHHAAALADALFGVTNPGGRLPYTLPRHSGQVPIYAGQKNGSGYRRTETDLHKGYTDMPATPLFAFGHGLSYTTFDYSELQLHNHTVTTGGEARFTVEVTNSGRRRGCEIVQLYISQTAVGVTRPARELVGFARVDLAPGQTATVRFTLNVAQLAYLGRGGDLVVGPGRRTALVGASSEDIRGRVGFDIDGAAITLAHRTEFVAAAEVSTTPLDQQSR